ncbi:hypothetical protein EVAR_40592_1 [Eumeta japonica]|uniref:Uncharacterized protein n=1 Tax=Eumeta variegata TaxID=151549 RepID=A0A4C1VWG6_EUMVA|nr:hypothetical protein EVAR_40592_1 [Eumeta japonica]
MLARLKRFVSPSTRIGGLERAHSTTSAGHAPITIEGGYTLSPPRQPGEDWELMKTVVIKRLTTPARLQLVRQPTSRHAL